MDTGTSRGIASTNPSLCRLLAQHLAGWTYEIQGTPTHWYCRVADSKGRTGSARVYHVGPNQLEDEGLLRVVLTAIEQAKHPCHCGI